MKNHLSKIISILTAFAIVASFLFVPAFAEDYDSRVTSFWDSYLIKGVSTSTNVPFLDGVCKNIAGIFSGAICAGASPDNLHHGSIVSEGELGGVDKAGQSYLWVKCKYCGDMFKGYASDLSAAYDDYVQTLPAQGYDSSGGLLWSPNYSGVSLSSLNMNPYHCPHHPNESASYDSDFSFSCNCETTGHFEAYCYRSGGFRFSGLHYYFSGIVPITGTYTLQSGLGARVSYGLNGGTSNKVSHDFSEGTSLFYSKGSTLGYSFVVSVGSTAKSFLASNCNRPVYKVVPDTILSGDTYNTNTRPTSITGGNYGIIGDNGQITKVEDNSTIINETNNTFYNPATGTTVPIVNWSYDYSDRSYKVTLESGDTATITYGDENITISQITTTEGDTITNNYTIYYLIDGSGSGEICAHEWAETSTTPATCTLPGSKLLTCSKCQQTKTEPLPALGHDWQVKQTVTTQYDDAGQLIQEGFTIYECSRCKEQYKSASGTSPPTNPSDPDTSGEGVFSGIFGLLLDFLSFFWKTFKDFTKSGVKAFLDALRDGTSDIFGLLNPFDWSA